MKLLSFGRVIMRGNGFNLGDWLREYVEAVDESLIMEEYG